jgi:hypothetical protein
VPAWLAGVVVGVGALRRGSQCEWVWLVAFALLLANLAFAAASGGDWMEAGRFLVPTVAPLALLAARGLGALSGRLGDAALALAVVLQLGGALAIARDQATGMPLWTAPPWTPPAAAAVAVPSWFERSNRIHRRDLPLAHHLDRVVDALAKRQRRPVRVLSRQMGMVMFQLARSQPGRVETLDRRGLVDRVFRSCPISNAVSRSAVGLGIDPVFAFRHRDELAACGIAPPDVIFDLGVPPPATTLARYGAELAIVYRQRGVLSSGSEWFPGVRVDGKAYVAVPRDRLPDLGPGWPIEIALPAR